MSTNIFTADTQKSLESSNGPGALRKLQISVISFFGALLLRLMSLTYRWSWVGFEGADRYWAENGPYICVFWHSRQLFMPWIYRRAFRSGKKRKMFVLISQHTDGRLIASAVRNLGIDSVAGSSTRGGREAFRELVRLSQKGAHVSITPDGPRGPVHKLKHGAVRLAQKSGSPIRPVAYSAESVWRLKTWDQFIIPKPFTRVVGVLGSPISIPAELTETEFERYRAEIEQELMRTTEIADQYFRS